MIVQLIMLVFLWLDYEAIKPASVTCKNQAYIQFLQTSNTLTSTYIKQAPVLSKYSLTIPNVIA